MTNSLKIEDLNLNEELDREAMGRLIGGARRVHPVVGGLGQGQDSNRSGSLRFSGTHAKNRYDKFRTRG